MTKQALRYNHLGYAPFAPKKFLVVETSFTSFEIKNEYEEVVFQGKLEPKGVWSFTEESCFLGDFSAFQKKGKYRIVVSDDLQSDWFLIEDEWLCRQLNANIKSFYYQRSGVELPPREAGKWARPAAHLDDAITFHPSMERPGIWNAHGGWYDAGDYGKYIVNGGVSVASLLLACELYPKITEKTKIYEEIRFELDFFLRMQDHDGGVFFKITPDRWDSFLPPSKTIYERRVLGKSTTSTLNFAGVMAHAHRIYANQDPVFAAHCLEKAKKAYFWAKNNPNVPFPNNTEGSGPYGDENFSDEFFWARSMLFRETFGSDFSDEDFIKDLEQDIETQGVLLDINWRDTQNLGWIALALQNQNLSMQSKARQKLKGSALEIIKRIENCPYRISLNEFQWGSNGVISNHALTLAVVNFWQNNAEYDGYISELVDYVYGRNPVNVSFVTGSAPSSPKFPHHRISGSDEIEEPIPGLLVGGLNSDRQDLHRNVAYPSELPGFSYCDCQVSFASNETAINWNAPLTFVLACLVSKYASI
jgi:endoglucanase